MVLWMARRTKRLWTEDEKRSICFQARTPDISVAQVARRYGMNANLIFKWLRDPRFASEPEALPGTGPCFLPVEIVEQAPGTETPPANDAPRSGGVIEIDIAGGHRLRIVGAYDPEALTRLIRGLSG